MGKIRMTFSDGKQYKPLTRAQLKGIEGGDNTEVGSETLGCAGLKEGDSCYYKGSQGTIERGTCRYFPVSGLICWGGWN